MPNYNVINFIDVNIFSDNLYLTFDTFKNQHPYYVFCNSKAIDNDR